MDRRILIRAIAIGAVAIGGGCADAPPQQACTGDGAMPMLEYHLFFGRNIRGRAPLSDQEWAAFAAQTVTPRLPNGFSAFDVDGQWLDPVTRRIVRERSKIIIVALPESTDAASAVDAVRAAYRTQFDQQSVGMTVHSTCAAF